MQPTPSPSNKPPRGPGSLLTGYANGGMLGSFMRLTGLAEDTPERKAYKAAREAEKAAEKAKPTPKETPAPMGSQSVIDRRMAAAGLKNGGKIKGPGTPTSDSIPAQVRETGEPIQVSTGERIVSAAQDALLQKIAKARGYESVDQMFEAETGKPVGPTIKGGKKAAEGGASQDDLAKRVSRIPGSGTASGTAPAPDGYDNGNDFTRNVNNSLNALGGMGVVASVPLKAAQAGQGAIRSAMNAPPVLQNMIPRLMGPAAQAAPDFIAGASGVAKAGGANLPSVVSNAQIPIAKATNVALQTGAKANQMAAGVRSFGNASAGLGMLDDQQERPVPRAPQQPSTSPIVSGVVNASTPPTNARAQRVGDPSSPDLNDEFSNAMIESRNPGGKVKKVVGPDGRVSYSGSNVSGEVSFQGADGNALPGRPGGGYMLMNGMSQDTINKTLTNPDGSTWSAGDNAIMAANIRDGVDKYRGTSRDPRNDPMNQPMTKDQREARVKMAEIAAQDRRFARTDAREQEQIGMTREEHAAKMAKEKRIADVQAEFMAAQGDPVKEAAVKRKMLALGLLKEPENKFTVVPEFDGTGQRIGTTVLDQNGKPLDFKQQVSTPKVTTQADFDKLAPGTTYTGADGKTYRK